jgi:phosphoenolpyruvate synthase/pyruvate phosphate dikinase
LRLPRAALVADHIVSEVAEFSHFGTNDLTQDQFGISATFGRFHAILILSNDIVKCDNLPSIDQDGAAS